MITIGSTVWMTPKEAAARFNVGLQTVYQWVYTRQVTLLDPARDFEGCDVRVTEPSLKTRFHISETSMKERTSRPWGPGVPLQSGGR